MKRIISILVLSSIYCVGQQPATISLSPVVGIANTTTAGIIKPDGTTVTIDTDGTLHSTGGGLNPAVFTNWSEKFYYVSPNGSDSNTGHNRALPLLSYSLAANLAYSNAPATIVLMRGNYIFPGTGGSYTDHFIVPPFVNVIGEDSNNVVITYTNTDGTISLPDMQPCGTNTITGVNFTFYSGCSSDVPLGNFGAQFLPANYTGITLINTNILEVYFRDCSFLFAGTGVHFEGLSSQSLYGWNWDRCKFICNNNFVQLREAGPLLTFQNCDILMTNWTNVPVINSKPFRMFETRTSPNVYSNDFPVRIFNSRLHYTDQDLSASNRPFYMAWNTQALTNNLVATNIFYLKDCTADAISLTNPLSIDFPPFAFNTQTQCVVTINNVLRRDTGGIFTVTSGYSLRTQTNNVLIANEVDTSSLSVNGNQTNFGQLILKSINPGTAFLPLGVTSTGQVTTNSVPSGSQTPLIQDINGAGFSITNLGTLSVTNLIVQSLIASNSYTPTNAFTGTTIDFSKADDGTTNLSGNLTFTGYSNISTTNVNRTIIHLMAGGADRTIVFPSGCIPGPYDTGVVSNAYRGANFLFELQANIFTNVFQLDW